MNNDKYKRQYLKYKLKYLNQKGGNSKCPNFGFTNLNDTCGINSLLLIILYSDKLKEIIQPKLNHILSYGIDKYINEIPESKIYLLPFNYEDYDICEYKDECIKYLNIIIERFNNNDRTDTIPYLKRQKSMECSDNSHSLLEKIYHHNKIDKDGKTNLEIISLIKLINYSLLFDDEIIYYTDNRNNLDIDKIIGINLVFVEKNLSEKKADGDDDIGHSVCCFTCGNENFYYDSNGVIYKGKESHTIDYIYDQQKIVNFEWKQLLIRNKNENKLVLNKKILTEINGLYENGAGLPFTNPVLRSIHYIYLGKNTNEYEYFKNDTLFFDLLQDYNNEKTQNILSKSLFIECLHKIEKLDGDKFIREFDNILLDIDLYDISGETLLLVIIKENLYDTIYTKIKKLNILDRLNKYVNATNLPNKYHYYPEFPLFVMYHKNRKFFNSFINDFARKISINNLIDKDNNTILHITIINDDIESIKLLLTNDNILLNIKNINDDTPLHIAFLNGTLEIIKLLLNHIKANKEIYKKGIEYKNKNNDTPIKLIKPSHKKYNEILILYKDTNSFLKSRSK